VGTHPPVRDWRADFDHTDAAWTADPFPIWDELRATCPVAHTERYGGAWLPVRHADVAAVAYDTEHFTSRGVVMSDNRPGDEDLPAPIGPAPPITSDPPFHALARRMLLPPFSPRPIAALEPFTRATCDELLDGIAGSPDGLADAATQYAQHIPVRVIAKMLGFPVEDADDFRRWIKVILEDVDLPLEQREERFEELQAYLDARIAEHVSEPRDDLTSYLLAAELDGQRLAPEVVRGVTLLLMVAGIDTTWSAIGASLWHLASHPDDRARLAADPGSIDVAVEELLRAYAPVTMARIVAEETELGDRTLHPGDWLLLPFPAANRDPAVFERADEVLLDRAVNRHAAFGLGIHRCLGSNLARMELRVAIEAWMARFADFTLVDPTAVTWSTGQVRGPRSIPVRLTPGA
jgi:cytochrome P450